MNEVMLGGRRLRLAPSALIGSGGEADVYDIGSGLALKLYKGPDHPDYRGLPDEQRAARERLATRGQKLREFPRALPPRVVAPLEVALDRKGQAAGYTMKLIGDAEPLLRWAEPAFRRAIPPAALTPLFTDLLATVARVHEAGVVIGDFNDLNVLAAGGLAHLIDADSFQFGPHPCLAYTERFVDPLCCEPNALRLTACHTSASDWYAFETLLFQCLLYVHPYGGVLPGGGRPCDRALQRVTIFDPRVKVPKAALPWKVLPDDLLQRFHETFVQDRRGPFPRPLLDDLRWTRCAACGLTHARAACPACALPGAAGKKRVVTVRGAVTATRLLDTDGEVVAVSPDGWLVYEGGEFRREDGTVALRGPLRPGTRYFLHGKQTMAVGKDEAVAFAGGRSYWERDGALWREGAHGDERFGEVLAGQTRLWAGPEFGFGFYRAGGVSVAFLFDAHRRGLADGVQLPAMRGRLLHADCKFGAGLAWLTLELERGGTLTRRLVVVGKDGAVKASIDDAPWLEGARGACAAGAHLFIPTDRGIVRVTETLCGAVEYSETEPFVDASTRLAAGAGGLMAANRREVVKLEVKQEARI
ncbi:MAG: hypothetical protein HYZ75_06770 [Elusimicrobia bacterium]|nr:hypothetical protein [Elusimicrobiota bacterium]